LGRKSDGHLAHILSYVAGVQPNIAQLLAYKPTLFPYFSIVLSDFSSLQPTVAIFQPYFASLLAD
jgi:hypothetical protein